MENPEPGSGTAAQSEATKLPEPAFKNNPGA